MVNEIIDPREYAYGPQINIPRRNAVDFTAGHIKSDYWHQGLASEVVSRNHSQFPAVRFYPIDGIGSGVAFTECEYTQGIAMPGQSIFTQLPSHLHGLKRGTFVITWPGYQHLKWRDEIVFVHPNGMPLTVGHMASQVASLWRRFYQKHGKDMRGHGIQLGANQISFNHLRLLQVYSNDGRTWQAEVSYVMSQ
ncbi:hypothetical protein DXG03_008257 [Asterophora parasitica]|uniref:Uncharacterized protein n=1 Tax=Asterophora parasitica TaxID=117018 RepID=A0A9P7GC09_9AGAR|nr:hypothetical protein DXG03_008257 [Asterophora parasitica]